MNIRPSTLADLPRMLEIYAHARAFMAQTGNPRQWGATNWPPEALLREDIACGRSFVCEQEGAIVGTFCYIFGDHVDPTYDVIEDGAWASDRPYGAVHRIASQGAKGVARFCLNWALEKCGYLRMDTHPDNAVMQHVLEKQGFVRRGTIYVEEDDDPRYAYDWSN